MTDCARTLLVSSACHVVELVVTARYYNVVECLTLDMARPILCLTFCLWRCVSVDASRDRSQIRCPICRGSVALPAGGVGSFPPSFLVNQLLDLMARQRRDVIPKCTRHPAQELMFCESCDQVFCMDCEGESMLLLV